MTYTRDAPVGLHWTGHPLVDMGVAGLTVFAQQRRPEDVTEDQLEAFVVWAQTAYFTKELASWTAVGFNANATSYLNPSFSVERRRIELASVIRSYKNATQIDGVRCAFFNYPATDLVFRDLIPLLTGRDLSNFSTEGQPGLAVSGMAITAIQGLSVAAPVVNGKLLVVSADDPKLLISLVQRWQPELRKRAQTSNATGDKQLGWDSPRTRFIDVIIEIEKHRKHSQDPDADYRGSGSIYHASNYADKTDVMVYTLELPALSFVRKAQNIKYVEAWQYLVRSSWREPGKDKDLQYGKGNGVYEAVFELPLEATKFIRRFFLFPVQRQLKPAQPADMPKRGKKTKESQAAPPAPIAAPVALWNLLELFLQEVLGMDRSRIDGIRTLGDRIAEWIDREKDKKLFRRIVFEIRRQYQVRDLLIKLSAKNVLGGPLRIDEYLNIFEEGEELAHADFGLAWDLTRMRIIESLFDKNYFETNKEALDDITIEDQE
jgi:CRISPR-associated protein Cst1